MADVSDFALAACTGAAVLAFYERPSWNRFTRRVFATVPEITVGLGLLGWGLRWAERDAAYWRSWADVCFEISVASGCFLAWLLFLGWLAKPDQPKGSGDAEEG